MRALDTETELRRALELAGCTVSPGGYGFRCGSDDALELWEAFKRLAAREFREPILGDGGATKVVGDDRDCDLLLFETATMEATPERGYRLHGDPPQPQIFVFSLTRQFSFEDEAGEYRGMTALCATVEHLLTPELQALSGAQLWGHAGPPPADGTSDENPEFGDTWTGDVHAWAAAVERHPAFNATVRPGGAHRVEFLYQDV